MKKTKSVRIIYAQPIFVLVEIFKNKDKIKDIHFNLLILKKVVSIEDIYKTCINRINRNTNIVYALKIST
jgi:hypothetical protein